MERKIKSILIMILVSFAALNANSHTGDLELSNYAAKTPEEMRNLGGDVL